MFYSWYFQTKRQMVAFEENFHRRPVIPPKVLDFPFFATSDFQFQEYLNFQGLQNFLSIRLPYYEDMVRVFYSNLHLTTQSYLATQIGTHKIRHRDWMNVANLKYDGLLLTPGTILEDIHFDCQQALLTMTREKVHDQNIRNVGSLTMNDRLLHYTWVHMLCPRGSNFSQLVHEDVFMLWCIKSNVMINWPHYIMQHMIKCCDNDMPLPYDTPHVAI